MSRLEISVLALLLAGACREKVPEPEPPPKPAKAVEAPAGAASAEASPDAEQDGDGGNTQRVEQLTKQDLTVGKGPTVKTGDTVRVHYTGTLLNGSKFDSSLDRDEPFEFTVGRGMVIKGWDEGVVGMQVGGKRKLTIPADKAYGKPGRPPKIPPNSPLVFEIELVEIS